MCCFVFFLTFQVRLSNREAGPTSHNCQQQEQTDSHCTTHLCVCVCRERVSSLQCCSAVPLCLSDAMTPPLSFAMVFFSRAAAACQRFHLPVRQSKQKLTADRRRKHTDGRSAKENNRHGKRTTAQGRKYKGKSDKTRQSILQHVQDKIRLFDRICCANKDALVLQTRAEESKARCSKSRA
jgi:hypothetical protein